MRGLPRRAPERREPRRERVPSSTAIGGARANAGVVVIELTEFCRGGQSAHAYIAIGVRLHQCETASASSNATSLNRDAGGPQVHSMSSRYQAEQIPTTVSHRHDQYISDKAVFSLGSRELPHISRSRPERHRDPAREDVVVAGVRPAARAPARVTRPMLEPATPINGYCTELAPLTAKWNPALDASRSWG
jgi:hypothetical protein